jgi:transcriptional regulator GlxA family with amidase domain
LRRITAPPGAIQSLLEGLESTFADGVLAAEETVIFALAACLRGTARTRPPAAARRRQLVMLRFQDYMSLWCERPVHIPDICDALDIPARTLEDYCRMQCGVSPYRLLRLFRLQQVHAALRVATSSTDSVSSASRRYGFRDLGRFAATYRSTFNELPSQTLAKAPNDARNVAGTTKQTSSH